MLADNLIEFLTRGPAHMSYRQILDQIDPAICQKRLTGVHTIWEELEHMVIAQEDIIRFTIDPKWKSPPWPEGYWPSADTPVNEERWQVSVGKFFADLTLMIDMISNAEIDLHAELPHAPGYTYIREVLLIIDHNAYHMGKIMQLKKMLTDDTS